MRNLCASLLAMLAVAVLAPGAALADTGGEPINTPDRFIVLTSFNNQAVFDKETGLVWERSPDTNRRDWVDAQFHCNRRTLGNRRGWRLPTIQELGSLIDPTVPDPGPTLPASHPVSNVQSTPSSIGYWSATTFASNASFAWDVFFNVGFVGFDDKALTRFVWCVRGGQGVDAQ